MFFPEGQVRVFLYGEPASMRLSFDGLYALARHRMGQDPTTGNLFAFINRRTTQIKVLYFDRTGWCIWSNQLSSYYTSSGFMRWCGFLCNVIGFRPIDELVPSTALLGRRIRPGFLVEVSMGVVGVSRNKAVVRPARER